MLLSSIPSKIHSQFIQQVSVKGCSFFCKEEEFSDTSLLHTHFHIRCPSVAICHAETKYNGVFLGKFQSLLPYHQHSPLTLWASITKSESVLSEQLLHFCEFPKGSEKIMIMLNQTNHYEKDLRSQ